MEAFQRYFGLQFVNIRKNYFYVSVRFKDKFFKLLAERYADRVIKVITSEDAGAITVEADALEAEERERAAAVDKARSGVDLEELLETVDQDVSCFKSGCLVSFVGLERVLGAPFRVTDDSTLSGDADLECLKARVHEQAQEVMCLYAVCYGGF